MKNYVLILFVGFVVKKENFVSFGLGLILFDFWNFVCLNFEKKKFYFSFWGFIVSYVCLFFLV